MRRIVIVISIFCSVLFLAGLVPAAEKGPVETVKGGCKNELDTYCKDVTPSEGRVPACLYCHFHYGMW
jgi:cysteine rich repeat protein